MRTHAVERYESISGAGQSCVTGLPASALSEFGTVQVLAGLQNLSALRNSKVSSFLRAVKHYT